MAENLIKQYNDLNNSFKKTVVFHIGESAGFFSEYNCMILAILYCLQNKIRFVLYSDDANFKYKNGWTDYFEPFCESTSFWIHKYLNIRDYSMGKMNFKDINILKWQIKVFFYRVCAKVSKPFVPFLYTQDLWYHLFEKKMFEQEYDIPELEIKGDFVHACNRLVELTWQFNTQTKREVEAIIKKVDLPDDYLSCHIRGGDKIIEYKLLPVIDYINVIKQYNGKEIFVLTDDYEIILQLQHEYSQCNWYTLCHKSEAGYNNSNFTKINLESKRYSLLKLFASMEIMNKSKLFIGTKTSNPSIFMSIRNPSITKGVDCVNENLIDIYLNHKKS